MTRFASAAAAVLLLLTTAGCASGNHSQAQPTNASTTAAAPAHALAAGPRHLTDLRDIRQLRSQFNTRSREPRLILLVSPT
jgi:hypothetical protein